MKRRDFIKTGMTAGGILIPNKSFGIEDLVYGRVIDTLSEKPVEGARVNIDGQEYITNSDGVYNTAPIWVKPSSWGSTKLIFKDGTKYENIRKELAEKVVARKAVGDIKRLNISHNDYYNAVRYAGNGEFNIDFFLISCMPKGIVERWATKEEHSFGGQPKWFVKTVNATTDMIDTVYDCLENDLLQLTKRVGKDSFVNNPHIEHGEEFPDYAKYRTEGWILVIWHNEPGFYRAQELDGRRFYSAVSFLSPYLFNKGSCLHEFAQNLGVEGNIEYLDFIKNDEFTQDALNSVKLFYSRPFEWKFDEYPNSS